MAFVPVSNRSRARGPHAGGRVWAVGSRAYVHSPAPQAAVVLTDEWDRVASASLDDGVEVEVCAWLPRGTAGARYHVRALGGSGEGWLGAERLRATREVPKAPPAIVAPVAAVPAGADPRTRRFGQR